MTEADKNLKWLKLTNQALRAMPGSIRQKKILKEIEDLKKMPVKKKAPAKKAPAKKATALGPKAKLLKLQVTTLRNKAKKLGISNVTTRTKENLAQSIILAEARKKRGTTAGKKATAKRKNMSGIAPDGAKRAAGYRQIRKEDQTQRGAYQDYLKKARRPGKRTSASGNVYYERRRNRSDVPGRFEGYNDLTPLNSFIG